MDGSLLMKRAFLENLRAKPKDHPAARQPPAIQPSLVVRPLLAVRYSFVVRIWQEESSSGWRGWVENTRTGDSAFVQQVDELLAFIEDRTGKL